MVSSVGGSVVAVNGRKITFDSTIDSDAGGFALTLSFANQGSGQPFGRQA
mgnify:CR=1 FL=1